MDLLAHGAPETMLLLLTRVGGLVLVAPVFSAKTIPPMLRAGLTVLLAVLLHPVAMSAVTRSATVPMITPAALLTETLIGFAIGLGAAVLVGAASLAGDLMGIQIGLSGAAVFDPLTSAENALGQFAGWFAITLVLAVDGHLVMLDAMARSFQALPVGSVVNLAGLLPMVKESGALFGLGLQFAAPVVATVLIANTALAILGRAAPQLNILSIAFPVQIGVGLFALTATVPFIGAFYNGWSGAYGAAMMRTLGALTPAAR